MVTEEPLVTETLLHTKNTMNRKFYEDGTVSGMLRNIVPREW